VGGYAKQIRIALSNYALSFYKVQLFEVHLFLMHFALCTKIFLGVERAKDLFESEFERMGFTAVEFRRLFSTSEKIVLPTGTPLSIEKETQEKTYFLLSGQVDVKSGDSIIATVRRNHFIGEMSFLSYLQEGTSTEAAADCYMSDKEPAVVFVWDNTVLRDYLIKDDNRGVKNALQASISNDLRKKIQRMTTTKRSKN